MRAGATKNRLLRRGAAAALALAIAAAGTACGDGDSSSRTPDRTARPAFECPPRRDAARGAVVTLFHETHTHGNLAGTHDRGANVTFARYAGLVEALRSCLRDPDASLFLGNGDDVSRGIEGIRTDGRHTVDAFNAGGLDADTFGFSEILFGEHYDSYTEGLLLLRELVAESRFAWVSANVRDAGDPTQVFASEQGARRWIVRRVGGVRVGITGLVSVKFSPGREQPLPSELASSIRVSSRLARCGRSYSSYARRARR